MNTTASVTRSVSILACALLALGACGGQPEIRHETLPQTPTPTWAEAIKAPLTTGEVQRAPGVPVIGDGIWLRRIDPNDDRGTEKLILAGDGSYGWLASPCADEPPSVGNQGPGYFRRGHWSIEGAELVLFEQSNKSAGSDEMARLSRTHVRRLPLEACTPADAAGAGLEPDRSCVVIDGVPFWRFEARSIDPVAQIEFLSSARVARP